MVSSIPITTGPLGKKVFSNRGNRTALKVRLDPTAGFSPR
jgi:hypothetical protein